MEFDYSAEQIQLRQLVREFAEGEIAPHVRQWDEEETFPAEIVAKLGRMGYLGVIFPEEFGGAGLGYVEYCILLEELARVDPSVALIVAAHTSLCANHIYLAGTDEQRRRYIPKLASGEWLGCWSLTEPEAGSDAAGTRTTAVRQGSEWVLNGAKTFTTNAAEAHVCVAMAVTNRAAGHRGISAFIIEKGTPGFRLGKKEAKMGMRATSTGEVIFEDCRLPASQLLGGEGQGFVDSLRVLDGGRISIAALSIGIAQGAFDASIRHARHRRQFGRPIGEFQAIQHKLVDMAVSLDAARLLTYRAARMADQGQRMTKEASMAKLFASEMAVRAAGEAVQIHGGYGFIKDYPVEKLYRDVKLCTIGEGTSEIQRLVIARQLLKDACES
jgi:alkylation response protein AidB-like acyl-CoA dehydrogenase